MNPIKATKKPITIEAMRWDGTDERSHEIHGWAEHADHSHHGLAIIDTNHIQHLWSYDVGAYIMPTGLTIHAPYQTRCLIIATLEGNMVAAPGWWIIKGVQGEFYPCDPDIFDATYDYEAQ